MPGLDPSRVPAPPVGLCESCVHLRVVENRRGSRFCLCELSASDPRFPRYPRLPVLRCRGFEPAAKHDAQHDTADGEAYPSEGSTA